MQIDIDSFITLPEPALEIKDIKKRIKLTQCRLFVFPGCAKTKKEATGKLFLKGFVRKNIVYAQPLQSTETTVLSRLRSFTVDVPFQCVTQISRFDTAPQPFEASGREKCAFFSTPALPAGFPPKENFSSADFTRFYQQSFQHFNELPWCELVSGHMIEFAEILDRTTGIPENAATPFAEGTFQRLEEKMIIDLRVKILQRQQVLVESFVS
ncbi:hypothetical protein BSNK01_14260 [Bacillaceae bacterium]